MTTIWLPAGNGHALPVTGAMLATMAACPPAPDEPARAPLRGWATPAGSAHVHGSADDLRAARHDTDTTAGSPVGQVRAMAWLLGRRGPTLGAYTCSRLAAGAARAGGYSAALWWLCAAGLDPSAADGAARLMWPASEESAGGVAVDGPAAGRVGPRRRPVSRGLGAAGSSPV